MLTLHTAGLGATLGLSSSQLHLLPDHDEDPERWRRRSEAAWSQFPDQRIDALRMGEIAFAARLEQMFRLLDSEGVHFRFEPGPLPLGQGGSPSDEIEEVDLERAETGGSIELRKQVLCEPISVEYLLLEYARLTDECASNGNAQDLSANAVPRLLVPETPTDDLQRFWTECDGTSSVLEIADRLGWPERQCKASIVELSVKGYLRFADDRELLAMAQAELTQNFLTRAAARLSAWVDTTRPGPPDGADVDLLLDEWASGKLPVVLASMQAHTARALLRRIELVDWDVPNSIQRWKEMRTHHRRDTISELHLIQWQLRSEDEADAPQMSDLLKLARTFQENDCFMRAAVLLRTAAQRMPETTSVRLEVGTRLIAVGLADEGAGWVLEACRTLIESGHAEKALGPLRNLLESDPTSRDARHLLAQAKSQSASGRKQRRNLILGSTMLVLVGAGAVVKVKLDDAYDQRLSEIAALASDPDGALAQLDKEFADDNGDRVATLRNTLVGKIEARKQGQRHAWLDEFKSIKNECGNGVPIEGLNKALELSDPPYMEEGENWPSLAELLDTIAARLEQSYAQLPPLDLEALTADSEPSTPQERALSASIEELVDTALERERTFTLDAFINRLASLASRVEERTRQRDGEIERRRAESLIEQQDRLLTSARNHRQAGDIERAVDSYRRLFAMEGAEAIRVVLGREKEEAEQHLSALELAKEFSLVGEHEAALAALEEFCNRPHEHALPWIVESVPTGAEVILSDGSVRETPFRMSTKIGESVELTFELEGHEAETLTVDRPTQVTALLSHLPTTAWKSSARVTALPVKTEGGHLLTNRAGDIVLLDEHGDVAWSSHLESLGGVARTPVFLPDRPDSLLILTEEGVAWLVELEDGRIEGPWSMNSPPIAGPTPTGAGTLATFADGRTALWTRRLKPQVRGPDDTPFEPEPQQPDSYGSDSGMAVLRRSANSSSTLTTPWGDWSVEVDRERYHVRHAGAPERSFHVRRNGEWAFVAWQAPDPSLPEGRLWISDDEGLRAFVPE